MSRRARRRSGRAGPRGAGWFKALGVLMALAVVGMAGGWMWLRSWLHGEDFRRMLSAEAGQALKAEAEFGPFHWDGTQVRTDHFRADSGGLVEKVEADGLRIDIGLGKVRQRIVELRDAAVTRIEVTLDLRAEAPEAEPPASPQEGAAPKSPNWYDRFLPDEVRLTGLEVGESSLCLRLKAGDATFAGTSWEVAPEGRSGYAIEARGGQVSFPWKAVPELELRRGRLRYQDLSVFLTESRFALFERGELKLTGEGSLSGRGFAFDGNLRDVRADEVLPEDWKQRVEGEVEANFAMADHGQGLGVNGTVRLINGVLTGLPVLDHLGAYGGSPRFRRLALNEAATDFSWEDGVLTLTKIRLGSEGLMRVEGNMRVDADRRLDGRFRVGLTPGTLASIPGAETKVFFPGERGLLWAPLRIKGTIDDPKEDLTARLIEAAGLRMFEILPETGERVLKYTRRAIDEDLEKHLETGRAVVDQGTDLIRRGAGLLDGEGDVVEEAAEVIRQGEDVLRGGEDVVKGVKGLFDVIRGKDDPPPPPEREEE